MPSSTSSSKSRFRLGAPLIALLLGLAALSVAVEAVTRLVINPASAIQRRVEAELANAKQIGPSPSDANHNLLMLGNSLLLYGVDMPTLRASLSGRWKCSRAVIESTSYLDWKYGLRRLISEGSRPDAVALVYSAYSFFDPNILRQDYFAHYLMRVEDLPEIVADAGFHPTTAAGMVLARFSLAYGIRSEVRKRVLSGMIPGLEGLTRRLTGTPAIAPAPNKMLGLLDHRAAELRQAAQAGGYRLILVLAPSGRLDIHQEELARLLRERGVDVIVPADATKLPRSAYTDGVHLSLQTARELTLNLARQFSEIL